MKLTDVRINRLLLACAMTCAFAGPCAAKCRNLPPPDWHEGSKEEARGLLHGWVTCDSERVFIFEINCAKRTFRTQWEIKPDSRWLDDKWSRWGYVDDVFLIASYWAWHCTTNTYGWNPDENDYDDRGMKK